jgi:hypothetical protein
LRVFTAGCCTASVLVFAAREVLFGHLQVMLPVDLLGITDPGTDTGFATTPLIPLFCDHKKPSK